MCKRDGEKPHTTKAKIMNFKLCKKRIEYTVDNKVARLQHLQGDFFGKGPTTAKINVACPMTGKINKDCHITRSKFGLP